jgi:RimJ/RimL family protein N-acetyltransferase
LTGWEKIMDSVRRNTFQIHKLITERCELRYPEVADAEKMHSFFHSEPFPRKLPLAQLKTVDQIERWIVRCLQGRASGTAFVWTAFSKETDHMVGQVSLFKTLEPGKWALGYWVAPVEWGKGFATEIAEAGMNFAFEYLQARVVWAAAAVWNVPSWRVLEKLGMDYLGENRKGYEIDSEWIPTREYQISDLDWQTTRALNRVG